MPTSEDDVDVSLGYGPASEDDVDMSYGYGSSVEGKMVLSRKSKKIM